MSSLFAHILAAVDDSEPSQRAIATSVAAAVEYKAALTFVHAVDWVGPVSQLESSSSGPADPTDLIDALRQEGQALISDAVEAAKRAGVTADHRLIEDRPVDAILAGAKDVGASVIVLGTHGRRGITRLLLGSVAEGVLRASHIPVLVVPS
jgi:nucleotide-binding universal stress UspA family protein